MNDLEERMPSSGRVLTEVDHYLDPDITERVRHARAQTTQSAYATHRRTFEAWCAEMGRSHLPATAATLATYADELTRRGLSPSTIRVHVSAVTSWHEENDLTRPDPRRANLLIRAYAHARAREGRTPRRADPLTVEHLRSAVASCGGDPAGLRDRCLVLLGFGLMARRGVLARLDISDVRVRPAGLEIRVRWDKRQPTGRVVAVPALGEGDPLCVVAAVKAWLAHLSGVGVTAGPLLRHVTATGTVQPHQLSPQGIWSIFRRVIVRAGLTGLADLTPHSMRAGGATEAYGAHADPLDIARHGGWVDGSTVLWSYIRGRDVWHNNPIGLALGAT